MLNGPKNIVIVNAGGRGELDASKGSYDSYINGLKINLERISEGKKERKFYIVVKVVKSIEEAGDLSEIDALLFVTLGMLYEAQKVQKKFKHLKVIVATNLLPEGEVVVADKEWLTPQMLYDFALYG